MNYLYEMLCAFYDSSEDGLIIYNGKLIKYQNQAICKLLGYRLSMTDTVEALGKELYYEIAEMVKTYRKIGFNKRVFAGKLCNIRVVLNTENDDIIFGVHIITDSDKEVESLRAVLDTISTVTRAQSDVLMTMNIAIDALSRKISNTDDVEKYINSANRSCLTAIKHNNTIIELTGDDERIAESSRVDRAIRNIIKMCETLLDKSRIELSFESDELCFAACSTHELENILYAVVSALLKENNKVGKVNVAAENRDDGVKITIGCKNISWNKRDENTEIVRLTNRAKLCGGSLCFEENELVISLPRGRSELCFKSPTEERPDMKRALIELSEVI